MKLLAIGIAIALAALFLFLNGNLEKKTNPPQAAGISP